MSTYTTEPLLDGVRLYAMFANGYRNLMRNMTIIDELNVFPVPDGDTGKNMTKTLAGGVTSTDSPDSNVDIMMKAFARGTLMSARGNSGVISSQIIRGMREGCKGKEALTLNDFFDVLESGVRRSYASVPNAVEGTILTVMREATEATVAKRNSITDFENCLNVFVEAMKASLAHTPELLPVLKEAGVVDSGGAGLICIFEGMLMELQGHTLSDDASASLNAADFHLDSHAKSTRDHVKYATVAVANGEGLIQYFADAGVDLVIDGGQTSNPSAQTFIHAFEELNADYIVVLPSNSNIIMTAEQAAKMYTNTDVRVIHTKSIPETYSSLSLMDPDSPTIENLIEDMTYYLPNVTTGYVTTATRDTTMNGVTVQAGHYIGLTLDTIYADSEDKFEAAMQLIKSLPNLADKQVITIFYGKDVTDDEAYHLQDLLYEMDPTMEVGIVDGGQDVYSFIMAIE